MKRLLLALLLLSGLAFAQAGRFDTTLNAATTVNGVVYLNPMNGAVVQLCNAPANATPCTNYATTYTDDTGLTACTGLNGCSDPITADVNGNFGFWATPGQYQYTYTYKAQNFGPYSVTVGLVPGTSGAANLNSGGSLGGTFTGNPTLSGNPAFTGSPTFSGTVAHTGTDTFKNLGSLLYANAFSGADIGAQINAAYAALPANGGRIRVSAQASCYSFTTPIAITTVNKPAVIEGDPDGATCLKYTPTTGNAITFDYGGQFQSVAAGIRDIELLGPCTTNACSGVTANGVHLGPANGAYGAAIYNSTIGLTGTGFQDAILLDNQFSFKGVISHNSIFGNLNGLIQAGNTEQVVLENNNISQNGNGLNIQGLGQFILNGNAFDDNTTAAIALTNFATITGIGNHFENAGLGTQHYITAAAGTPGAIILVGGDMEDAHTSGTDDFFVNFAGTFLSLDGVLVVQYGGGSVTQVANLGTTSGVYLAILNANPTLILADYNASYTGHVIDMPRGSSTSYRQGVMNFENLSLKGTLKISDQGSCTMAAGACSAQTLVRTYATAPTCIATWTGTGTLAGVIKIASSTTTVTPSSSTGTDTAQVNWVCFGN